MTAIRRLALPFLLVLTLSGCGGTGAVCTNILGQAICF